MQEKAVWDRRKEALVGWREKDMLAAWFKDRDESSSRTGDKKREENHGLLIGEKDNQQVAHRHRVFLEQLKEMIYGQRAEGSYGCFE